MSTGDNIGKRTLICQSCRRTNSSRKLTQYKPANESNTIVCSFCMHHYTVSHPHPNTPLNELNPPLPGSFSAVYNKSTKTVNELRVQFLKYENIGRDIVRDNYTISDFLTVKDDKVVSRTSNKSPPSNPGLW